MPLTSAMRSSVRVINCLDRHDADCLGFELPHNVKDSRVTINDYPFLKRESIGTLAHPIVLRSRSFELDSDRF